MEVWVRVLLMNENAYKKASFARLNPSIALARSTSLPVSSYVSKASLQLFRQLNPVWKNYANACRKHSWKHDSAPSRLRLGFVLLQYSQSETSRRWAKIYSFSEPIHLKQFEYRNRRKKLLKNRNFISIRWISWFREETITIYGEN